LNLQIKSYEAKKNLREIWARQACAEAHQQELTICAKKCGQEERREILAGGNLGHPRRAGEQPLAFAAPLFPNF
jgi:hypothetical protein